MFRNGFYKVICLCLTLVMLVCIVSCNDSENATPTETNQTEIQEYGNETGDMCLPSDLETFDGKTFNIEQTRGKVTVINFWGEWCPWCLYELPEFDRVASEYSDDVTVAAIHSVSGLADGLDYAAKNYPDTKMIFIKDAIKGGFTYYDILGGNGSYPRTIVLDREGKIVFSQYGAMSYDALVEVIKNHI